MNLGTMLAWGTGASGNWQIALGSKSETARGFREFTHRIRATGKKLFLTSYDELTMAAQFKKIKLPQQGTEDWFFPMKPGDYECRVVQLYSPTEAQSEEVFNQTSPHFLIELSPAKSSTKNKINEVPWFDQEH
jgi:hypothetical protein